MQSKVVLRDEAAPAPDFVHLSSTAGKNRDPRSYTIAVRFSAECFEDDPVSFVATVPEQAGSVVHIVDNNLQAPISIEIARCRTSRAATILDGWSGLRGDVSKRAIVQIEVNLT